MNLLRRYWKVLLIAVALFLCFVWGRNTAPKPEIKGEIVRVDTLLIRDTITREKPVYRTKWVRDTMTIIVHDSIPVYLPVETKVYEDSTYRAEVSGVFPSLDRIEVYQRTQVVTQRVETQVAVPVRQRWGIGIQAGYGATLNGKAVTLSPYLGIGITYNIISW